MRWARALPVLSVLVGFSHSAPANAYTLKFTESGARIRWCVDHAAMRLDPAVASFLESEGGPRAVDVAIRAWDGLPGTPGLQLNNGAPPEPGYQSSGGANGVYVLTEGDWNARDLGGRLAVTVTTYDASTGCIFDADVLVNSQHPYYLAEETTGAGSTAIKADEGNGDDGEGDEGGEENGDKNSDNTHDADAHARNGEHESVPDLIAVDVASAYDLGAVLTHEMGHVIGLGESNEYDYATMWPQIGMAEVHQRTLSFDDEDGATAVYEGVSLAAPTGCGGATVAGRTRVQAWIPIVFFALALIAVAVRWRLVNMQAVRLRGARRSRRAPAGLLLAAAVVAIGPMGTVDPTRPGFDEGGRDALRVRVARVLRLGNLERSQVGEEELRAASRDSAAEVRIATAAVLELRGSWEDREIAAALSSDGDARVARVARAALVALETAPPREMLTQASSAGRVRWAQAFDAGAAPRVGRVARRSSAMTHGIVYTTYEMTSPDGTRTPVHILGGRVGNVVQQVGEASPPPDSAEIALQARADGRQAWTHHREGVFWGGWLEEGPGVRQ